MGSCCFSFPPGQMKGWSEKKQTRNNELGPTSPDTVLQGSQRSRVVNRFWSHLVAFRGLSSCPVWLGTTDPKKGNQLSITGPCVSHFRDYPWKNLNPGQAASLCHPECSRCQSWSKQGIRPHVNSSPSQQ